MKFAHAADYVCLSPQNPLKTKLKRRKSFIEVQRLTMTANVVRERQRYGKASGLIGFGGAPVAVADPHRQALTRSRPFPGTG